nr:hypothetical protein [uncultured Desulfobacter sp.]
MVAHLKLTSSLKRLYWLMTGPALIIFACLFMVTHWIGKAADESAIRHLPGIWHGLLFTGAAVTAIAGPLMMRITFAHRVRQLICVQIQPFLTFQRRLIVLSGITPYLALTGVWGGLSQFHAGGIILMALYGAYYYFPSEKRISYDIKLFRVALND